MLKKLFQGANYVRKYSITFGPNKCNWINQGVISTNLPSLMSMWINLNISFAIAMKKKMHWVEFFKNANIVLQIVSKIKKVWRVQWIKVDPGIQFKNSKSTTRKWSAETEWWWWWIYHVIKTLLATLKRSPNTKETKDCKGNLLLLAREMILSCSTSYSCSHKST